MSECIAMAVGVILGAACVIVAAGMLRAGDASSASQVSAPSPQGEGFGASSRERELLQKQLENFLMYNGTEEGQIPIGDE